MPPVISDAPLLVAPLPINNLPEVPVYVARSIEVAVYRVTFEDADENGQPEQDELPSNDEVKNAKTVEEGKMQVGKKGIFERVRIKQLDVEGTPTAQQIDEFKNEFINDPEQTSGAYSIIQKDVNNKETVLEVFSVRDWPEEIKTNQPVISQPDPASDSSSDKPTDSKSDQPKAENAPEQPAPAGTDNKNASLLEPRLRGKWETRLASSGVLVGALAMIRQSNESNSRSLLEMMSESSTQEAASEEPQLRFDSRSRRARRWRSSK